MQYKISHLMIVITCFAGAMAIRNLEVFRQSITILFAIVGAYILSSVACQRQSDRAWRWGAMAGIGVAFVWNLIVFLTWPTFVFRTNGVDVVKLPIEFFSREVAFFLAFSAIVGAAVGGWVTVSRRSELQSQFSIAVIMSKLILLAAIGFRLLTLVGEMRPDWSSLSLFCCLVFVIHTFNWLSRLHQSIYLPEEIKMRKESTSLTASDGH